ncbi:bifunctional phosphoribosyl-AMP cyclohydrolase/phosphoribosyl-ATP diphosphatase HisIE [Candidatus Bipolaricaulota bacterium]|nr:bifunctional phosphoribosyl-AMP cyclohydrolase/phosphoribosyl-ATP diphosphatase HisIE [Candidatus Bipolaricaulota bacterium]
MSEKLNELTSTIDWSEDGLIPAIAQSSEGDVLTLAYMDEEALRLTLSTGYGHYYSRSKARIRKKGEVSGNTQEVKEIRVDCDEDALLLVVDQQGPACHTGEDSCFYRQLGEPEVEKGSIDYSLNVLKELEEVVKNRKESRPEDSYTADLFREGSEKIRKKVGEEAIEVVVSPNEENLVAETADLLYHLLVLLRDRGIELGEVMAKLEERRK